MEHNFGIFRNLLKNKHFRSGFLKYFSGMTATVLVIVIIYTIISYNLYSMYLQNTVKHFHERSLYKTSEFVDYVFESIEKDFSMIAEDKDVSDFISLQKEDLDDIGRAIPSRIISNLFTKTILSSAMDSIYVYSFINDSVVTWTDYRTMDSFSDKQFMDMYHAGHTIYTRRKEYGDEYKSSDVITLIVNIEKDEKKLGVVAFNLKSEVFAQYVNQGFENMPENVYVADQNGDIFFTDDRELINRNINDLPTFSELFSSTAKNGSDYTYADNRVISSVLLPGNGFTVISVVEGREINDFRSQFVRLIIGGLTIGLIIAFMISVFISYRLYRNVIRLISYVGTPEGIGKENEISGEMAYITENITYLIARNKHIEHELADKLIELKKAQGIALQNQINPHFILNTLQLVNLDIMRSVQGDTIATKVISLLSEILQSNLNTKNHIVPLSYEISQAVKYIEIENIRNKRKFHAEWDVDEKLLDYKTVKFIIQPILENSIKHGLMNSPLDEKKITITIKTDHDNLIFRISDNGLGITSQALDILKKCLKDSYMPENSHIGLCNVDKRIKLVFGESFGVSIDSAPNEGTVVTIRQKLLHSDWGKNYKADNNEKK